MAHTYKKINGKYPEQKFVSTSVQIKKTPASGIKKRSHCLAFTLHQQPSVPTLFSKAFCNAFVLILSQNALRAISHGLL
jgi:hypothetical protein